MSKKYSLLIVDDQPNWRMLLTELIQDGLDEFALTSVGSYEEAIQVISARIPPFHVVITDLRLKDKEPGNEDGLKLIEELNRLGDTTKTILITGYPTVKSAKRALAKFNAYDYLEKHPSDGTSFDVAALLRSVQKAAKEAEQHRPNGFTGTDKRILLIESDDVWKENILGILHHYHYDVDCFSEFSNVQEKLAQTKKLYDLVLVNDFLLHKNISFLDLLNDTQSWAGVVVLDHGSNLDYQELLRSYALMDIFNLKDYLGATSDRTGFNGIKFLKRMHKLLAKSKHLVIEVVCPGSEVVPFSSDLVLKSKETYQLNLYLQDRATENSRQISPDPTEDIQGFLFAEHMTIETESQWTWNIGGSGDQMPSLAISPQESGAKKILLEVSQGFRLLRRVSVQVVVD